MSIKKKIQQSMTVILTVTLVLAYVILSVILYNRNMNLLQTEVKQEAAYIREAINLSDSDYMKQMDNVVESTRVTQIKADGTVLYDSRRDADILKNHGNRKEVREALSKGEGADVRKSETVGKDMYYYALLLNDGTVLRVSKSIDNLASTAVSLMPVMGILAVLTILFAFALARWQTNRLIKPINELDVEQTLARLAAKEEQGVTFVDIEQVDRKAERIKGALVGAGLFTAIMLLTIGIMAWSFCIEPQDVPPLPLLVVLFGIPAACIIGTLKVLVDRLKEIGKGEEDAYRNY